MKYTIEGFSQEYALTLRNEKTRLDCIDLVILRWIVDFYPRMSKITIDGKEYAWLCYQKLCDDLPIISISKRVFAERLKKLVEFDILVYKLIKENGTFTAYGFGNNYENLIAKKVVGCSQNDNGGVVETTTKYNILNNIKEIDNNKLLSKEREQKPIFNEELFNKFYKAYPIHKSRGSAEKAFKKLNPSEELVDVMINKIKILKETKKWKENNGQYIPYPSTWLNAKGWEDELSKEEDPYAEYIRI